MTVKNNPNLHRNWIEELRAGQRTLLWKCGADVWNTEQASGALPQLWLAGSFNPLHQGHRELLAAAERHLEVAAGFELSVRNADKPPLEPSVVTDRAEQFAGQPLLLTLAPTFLEKSRLLPGCWFVVGYDTAIRILQPRFYGDCERAMQRVLAEIRNLGCRFLVAGRLHRGTYQTLHELALPDGFGGLFAELPESAFRRDISSTELRGQS